MLFTEPLFLFLFLPLLLAIYFLPFRAHRNGVLLAASLVFYASGGGSFLFLMLMSIAANYLLAVAIDRSRGTAAATVVLAGAVAANLAVLGWFKYANFLVDNLNVGRALLGWPASVIGHVALPIGISFFTFHAISYIVDVYRGHAIAQKNPVHAALYMLLFPQLIAGPIIRYREIAAQLATRVVSRSGFAYGVRRFVVGLAKKVMLANAVAVPADLVFNAPVTELTAPVAWLGLICYTLQIYFDFSGYSDMAVGLAAMFGFRFPENFNYPYIARSIQEFWRRWHISLSSWFRDYLYIPLGGNRRSAPRVCLNLVVVFFLCGLWHGASWTFVVWGLFHGLFLGAERIGLGRWLDRRPAIVARAYTLLVVMIGWVFFRADSLGHATAYLSTLAGLGATAPSPFDVSYYLNQVVALTLAAGVVGATPFVPWLRRRLLTAETTAPFRHLPIRPPAMDACATVLLAMLLFGSAVLIAANSYSPFIYFRF